MAEKVYPYYRRWQDWVRRAAAAPLTVAITVASIVAIYRVALLIMEMDLVVISGLAAVPAVLFGILITGVVQAFLEIPIALFACLAVLILGSVLSFVDMRVGLWSFREIVLTETSISFRRRGEIQGQQFQAPTKKRLPEMITWNWHWYNCLR